MSDTLIIYEKNNAYITAGFSERKLESINISQKNNVYEVGNIYVGHITKVLMHLNAAYVDIGMPKPCYMELEKDFDYISDKNHGDGTLHAGDDIIVQISKEEIKTKPITVSAKPEIASRYYIISYSNKKEISFSSKLKNNDFKLQIKKELEEYLPDNCKVLFRTNSNEVNSEDLIHLVLKDIERFFDTIEKGKNKTKGSLIYETNPGYYNYLRDFSEWPYKKVITDSPEVYIKLKDLLSKYFTYASDTVEFYNDEYSLETLYDMKKNLTELTSERVWLKSGGQIVIEPTESLTSIDVNSAKASSSQKNISEGFLKINIEAAEEISRQLMLRNISGIIIIDFINMRGNKEYELMTELKRIFDKDKLATIVDFTKLGLLEVTRKRQFQPVSSLIKKYKLLQ